MAHNDQASGSHRRGDGYSRPMNLNSEEAQILANNRVLVPLAWHLGEVDQGEGRVLAAGSSSGGGGCRGG
jgi:hypothetical protein